MSPIVSVILPVYNSGKYLEKCIESILSQTLKNIEIIAVDDGSTDNSGNILDKYALEDNRIKVIHQDNKGVSEARNVGLKYIQSNFVVFVDSDDWLDKDMLELMIDKSLVNDVDIVMCGYVREFPDHSKMKKIDLQDNSIYRKRDISEVLRRKLIGPVSGEAFNIENLDMYSVLWNKLYRADLIKGLSFIPLDEIGSCEDLIFNLSAFSKAESLMFINKPYYHYRKNVNTSVTSKYRSDLVYKRICLFNYIKDFIDVNKLSFEFYEALNNRVCLGIMGLGLNILSMDNKANIVNKIMQFKDMLSNQRISTALAKFEYNQLPLAWRMYFSFAKYKNAICFCAMTKAIQLLISFVR